MAKKFWEREDFDIALFASVFNGVYTLCYECVNENDSKTFEAYRQDGDAMMYNAEVAPLVKAFCDYRQDGCTSDREVAALAMTYGWFYNWALRKEGEV